MTIRAEMHDGTVLEFPDGTSDEVVTRTVKGLLANGVPPPAAQPEKGFLEKAGDFAQGLRRVRDNALTLGFGDEMAGVAGGVGPAIGAMLDPNKSVADEFSKGYEAARDKARGEEKQFRQDNPGTALAADLTVGLGAPVGGITKGIEAVAGAAPRFLKYAAAGATAGGIAGAGYADGDLGDRAEGAATGATIGGIMGAGIPIAANAIGSVAERVGRPIMDRIGQGPARAVDRKILQAIERDGSTVDQVQARMRTLGPEATIADAAGENTAGLVEAAANQPGPGRQMANRVLQGRQKEAGDRIKAAAQRELGDGGYFETLDDLNLARREAAAPLYDQAYAQNFVANDAINGLMQRPSMKSALGRAHKIAAEEGRDPNALGLALNDAGDVVFTKAPSMQTLDYVKRGLDDVLEGFRDSVTGKLRLDEGGRAINATRAAFVKELRDLNPAYAEALDAWSGPSSLMDAMAKGRSFARPDAEITEKIVAGLSPAEKEAFLLGVRRGIDDIVDRTGSMADATRKLAGTPKMQKALAAAFPDTGSYRRFMADLMRESRFNQTRNTALSGSQTARRLAGQEDAGIDPMPLADIAQGNFLAGARGLFRQMTQNTKKLPDTQAQALARALLDSDPAANAATFDRLRGGTNVLALTDDQRRALAAALAGEAGAQFPAITSR